MGGFQYQKGAIKTGFIELVFYREDDFQYQKGAIKTLSSASLKSSKR